MSELIFVNDVIEYDEKIAVGKEDGERDIAPKKYSGKKVKSDKFKDSYFAFYDDVKSPVGKCSFCSPNSYLSRF